MKTSSCRNRGKVLWINGEKLDVPCGMENQPLAAFIKTQAKLKSVKVACGEGGCGACAIAIVEQDQGSQHLRTINSCLTPLYSVLGRSIVTAEGLPALAGSGVADRLAAFHASQCGYCTPGFTVACHAALHNAAAAGDEGASSGVDDSRLHRALDGNLCRCTGYRPIVSACRSLAAEICDLEDLCKAGGPGCTAANEVLGAAPQQGYPLDAGSSASTANGVSSPSEAAAAVEEVSLGAGQVLRVPRSLDQLVAESGRLAADHASGGEPSTATTTPAAANGSDRAQAGSGCDGPDAGSWRLVAGNTGHGIFKDWPTTQAVLLSLAEIPELQGLEIDTSGVLQGQEPSNGGDPAALDQALLRIGACVTLERLAAFLEGLARGSAGARDGAATTGRQQWAAETAAHLYRIAGTHVRNMATVGGNLVLASERGLPSDVATLLGAAGAQVELILVSAEAALHGTVVRLDLMAFLAGHGRAGVPPGCSYVLTAVQVPVPPTDPRVRFWSQRIADRYSNAAAVANAAVMVRLSAAMPGPAGTGGNTDQQASDDVGAVGEVQVVEEVRIVVGVRTAPDGSALDAPERRAKLTDPAALELDGWRCVRATAAEAVLRGRPANATTVVAALEALLFQDMMTVGPDSLSAPKGIVEGGAEAAEGAPAAAIRIAEGLVAQGILACTGQTLAAHTTLSAESKEESQGNGSNGCHGTVPSGGSVSGGSGAQEAETSGTEQAGAGDSAGSDVPPDLPIKLPRPPLVCGNPSMPEPVPSLAPVTEPLPKLGAKLQASGTAHYTEDVPVHARALYGAFVLAAKAGAVLASLDPSAALALPGVVRFVCAADLVAIGAQNHSDPHAQPDLREPLFVGVGGRCEFAGQAVGLVLADSPWHAEQAAKAVHVAYGKGADDAPPILDIGAAVRAGSFFPVSKIFPWFPAGPSYGGVGYAVKGGGEVDVALGEAGAAPAAALAAAALGATPPAQRAEPSSKQVPEAKSGSEPSNGEDAAKASATATASAVAGPRSGRVVSGRYFIPSQLHFYMETQSAVAWPDEDGCVVVHSSCQGTDMIQAGVATALGLPYNKIHARCRRVGGGFGGKLSAARHLAAVAAVAAVATGRQVRIKVPRNTDAAMNGGRCETDVSYVAVVDEPAPGEAPRAPRIRALDIHAVLMGGAYVASSFVDAFGLLAAVDSVYSIPAFRAEAALVRCNVPPRVTVRGPGEIQGAMIIEQIMEHVAVALSVDPEELRRANFIQLPVPAPQPPPEPALEATSLGENGKADAGPQTGTAAAPTPQAVPSEVKTTTGKAIPARLFNLEHIWTKLRHEANWEQLKADVEAFNKANTWRKWGLAMMPTRYMMFRGRKPAYVSALSDGTVQVATHGIEMGQGLFTKVAQVAALTLAQVLPTARQPLDVGLIRVADNSTELLPHSGITSSSTTSEMACAAVRLACLQIVENLRKHAVPKMAGRDDFGWKELIASVSARGLVTAPLSAFAWGGQADLPESSGPDAPGAVETTYHVLGVALAVAEVDVLTGERRVLRSDILFDLGRPVNPAVDLGQVEGAFVQGLGMMLQEQVTHDDTTGALLQTSTWSYKPPGVACAPQQLNVHILNDAPLATGGPVSSKACGEPPLLLSYVALAALQRAVHAARKSAAAGLLSRGTGLANVADGSLDARNAKGDTVGHGNGNGVPGLLGTCNADCGDDGFQALLAPATVERVRLACGNWTAAQLLKARATRC